MSVPKDKPPALHPIVAANMPPGKSLTALVVSGAPDGPGMP